MAFPGKWHKVPPIFNQAHLKRTPMIATRNLKSFKVERKSPLNIMKIHGKHCPCAPKQTQTSNLQPGKAKIRLLESSPTQCPSCWTFQEGNKRKNRKSICMRVVYDSKQNTQAPSSSNLLYGMGSDSFAGSAKANQTSCSGFPYWYCP